MTAHSTWIIDARNDTRWLLGGVLVSYALLAAHLGGAISTGALWWIWIVLLDGPHVFATLSRTYLDRRERQERAALLAGSLSWFLAGPAAFALSALVGTPLPFGVFLTLAMLWAYWHVVRQHYGFLALYKRRNGDGDRIDHVLDSALLYGGLLAPFVSFALTQPRARRLLGLAPAPTWERGVSSACFVFAALLVLAFTVRQLVRHRRGLGVNRPKCLFFLAVLPLTAVLFSPWVVARADFGAFFIVVTAYHNVQYHAMVWFYQRKRFRGADPAPFGLAPRIMARFAGYAACGVAFTLVYRLAGCGAGVYPLCEGLRSARAIAPGLTLSDLVNGALWGFALHHYYLDQKIWRVSRDAGLRRTLDIAEAPPRAAAA